MSNVNNSMSHINNSIKCINFFKKNNVFYKYKIGQIVLIYLNFNSDDNYRRSGKIMAIENENFCFGDNLLPPWYITCLLFPCHPCSYQPIHFDVPEDEIISICELERFIYLLFGRKFIYSSDNTDYIDIGIIVNILSFFYYPYCHIDNFLYKFLSNCHNSKKEIFLKTPPCHLIPDYTSLLC